MQIKGAVELVSSASRQKSKSSGRHNLRDQRMEAEVGCQPQEPGPSLGRVAAVVAAGGGSCSVEEADAAALRNRSPAA